VPPLAPSSSWTILFIGTLAANFSWSQLY